jgi:hypothetical protein
MPRMLGRSALGRFAFVCIADSFLINSTPAQNFLLILDTGSSDMWVADQDCTTNTCSELDRFNTASSSTYEASSTPFQISYGSGDAAGLITRDTVTMGGFTIQNQGFGASFCYRQTCHKLTCSDRQPNHCWIGLCAYIWINGSSMGAYCTDWRSTFLGGIGRIGNLDNAGNGCVHAAIPRDREPTGSRDRGRFFDIRVCRATLCPLHLFGANVLAVSTPPCTLAISTLSIFPRVTEITGESHWRVWSFKATLSTSL